MTEFVDIYDAQKQRTGQRVPREGAFMQPGQYTFYVLAIIKDAQGRFLITQRSLHKHWEAGWWEVSGGGVRAGETPEEALVREVREEVGLDISQAARTLVYSYTSEDNARGDNYHVNMYTVELDFSVDDVVLQQEEAVACQLATWQDICALNEQGIFLHFSRVQTALGL